jgi:hypothetical protein
MNRTSLAMTMQGDRIGHLAGLALTPARSGPAHDVKWGYQNPESLS